MSICRRNPNALREIKRRARELANKSVYVGLPSATDGELVMRGAVHQFGSPSNNIPARPWLDKGAQAGIRRYKQLARSQISSVIDGTTSATTYYNLWGEMGKSETQQYLRTASFTPLKPETIKRKGSSKPLIDTGQMRNAITYEIK